MARHVGKRDPAWWLKAAKIAKYRLTGVSDYAGVKPKTTQRHIRALFAQSAQEWLNEERLKAVPGALKEFGSAKVAADKLGFVSAAHFSRVCKERYGDPPMRFLKRSRAG